MKALILIMVLASSCGAQKEKPRRQNPTEDRKKPTTFGKDFDPIPVQKGFGKPVAPFPFFEGTSAVPGFKPGDMVWSPVPVGGAWDIVNYSIARVKKVVETRVHLDANGVDFVVPGAMLQGFKRPKARLKRGDTVLCAISMSSEWGKVVSTAKGRVLVSMVWARGERKEEIPVERLLLLEAGKPSPGMPVVFSRGGHFEFGQLIHRARTTSWIIGYAGKLLRVKNDEVKLVPTGVKFPRKGRVWTLWYDKMEEARVEKVLENGAGYMIRFPERPLEPYRNPRLVSFARVTKPLG
ncbi:hypothetical protein KKF84_00455 [Myxococcota bacterium]|nr:hypothetical protein [Myxococcota bacterium]MBU1533755.1 hypothetical protein [Myxococcota bacterium]